MFTRPTGLLVLLAALAVVLVPAAPAAAGPVTRLATSGCAPSVVGHRGTSVGVSSNNTIAAFTQAVEDGADALELDIRRTKPDAKGPGTWVVFHDAVLDGLTIADTPYATLLQQRPDLATFRQAMEYVASTDVSVQVEVKPTTVSHTALRYFARTAATLKIADRFELDSAKVKVLTAFRKVAPALATGYIVGHYVVAKRAKKAATTLLVKRTKITAKWTAALHRAGVLVQVWTVNDPEEWSTFTGYGVDGLVTDDPAGLVAWCTGAD